VAWCLSVGCSLLQPQESRNIRPCLVACQNRQTLKAPGSLAAETPHPEAAKCAAGWPWLTEPLWGAGRLPAGVQQVLARRWGTRRVRPAGAPPPPRCAKPPAQDSGTRAHRRPCGGAGRGHILDHSPDVLNQPVRSADAALAGCLDPRSRSSSENSTTSQWRRKCLEM